MLALIIKIAIILMAVILGFFLLTMIIYFFNLDMKLASKLIPVMKKYYDHSKKKRLEKEAKRNSEKGKE